MILLWMSVVFSDLDLDHSYILIRYMPGAKKEEKFVNLIVSEG